MISRTQTSQNTFHVCQGLSDRNCTVDPALFVTDQLIPSNSAVFGTDLIHAFSHCGERAFGVLFGLSGFNQFELSGQQYTLLSFLE